VPASTYSRTQELPEHLSLQKSSRYNEEYIAKPAHMGETTTECGEEVAAHFALAPGYRNLNHGMSAPLDDDVDLL
jgi:hypothetical protein